MEVRHRAEMLHSDVHASTGAFVVALEQFGAPNQTDFFMLNETGTNGPGWPTGCPCPCPRPGTNANAGIRSDQKRLAWQLQATSGLPGTETLAD
jgi:hypothetical protein